MMRSNFRVSSAMAPISISSVSMISASRIATPAWHTAESLYEAVAQALGILREDQWVEEIGEGLTEVRVRVNQAARRRALGADEGLQAAAGVAGQDARRMHA
jgi:hypothetical protein